MSISLRVNGKNLKIDADPEMPLLWALRDVTGIKGPKYGCGKGLCGACSVQMDGESIRSCSLPVRQVGASEITTIEGLLDDKGKALKEAWNDIGVPQCGYCQAGQIISAHSLLTSNPKPSEADIDDAMIGNICRCGTYSKIKEAIKIVAKS